MILIHHLGDIMNSLKHEHRLLIDELTEAIYDALDSDDIFDIVFAFVESKYQAELKDGKNIPVPIYTHHI